MSGTAEQAAENWKEKGERRKCVSGARGCLLTLKIPLLNFFVIYNMFSYVSDLK
jgi:hypothetical protein